MEGGREGGDGAGLLSKSLLDGKHKVINLRPAGWQDGEGGGGLRGLWCGWRCLERRFPGISGGLSGGDGLIKLALPCELC